MQRTFLSLLLFSFLVSFTTTGTDLPDDVLTYTNQFRKSKGMPALVMRDDLNAIAAKHSADMASGKKSFGHDGFDGRESQAIQLIPGLQAFAENVAYGPVSGQEVVTMWKNSNGHRRNMLGKFKYIGIGTAKDKGGRIYYTQVFVN